MNHQLDLTVVGLRDERETSRYAGSVDLKIMPAPRVEGVMPTDFGHADELIADGLRAARASLARRSQVIPLRPAA